MENEIKYVITAENKTKPAFEAVGKQAKTTGNTVNKAFTDAFKKLDNQLGGFGQKFISVFKSMNPVVIALTAAVGALTVGMIAFVSTLNKLDAAKEAADKINLTTAAYMKFDYMLKQNGSSMEENRAAFARLGTFALEFSKKNDTATNTLKKLGFQVKDANGNFKSQEQLMTDLLETLGKVDNKTLRAALATSVFGKQAANLLPLINNLESANDGTAKMFDKMSDKINKASASADNIKDSFTRMQTVLGLISIDIAFPWLQKIEEWLSNESNINSLYKFGDIFMKVVNSVIQMSQTLWQAIKWAFNGIVFVISSSIEGIIKSINWLIDKVNYVADELNKLNNKGFNPKVVEDYNKQIEQLNKTYEASETLYNDLAENAKKDQLKQYLERGIISKEYYDDQIDETEAYYDKQRYLRETEYTNELILLENKRDSYIKRFGEIVPAIKKINETFVTSIRETSEENMNSSLKEAKKQFGDWTHAFDDPIVIPIALKPDNDNNKGNGETTDNTQTIDDIEEMVRVQKLAEDELKELEAAFKKQDDIENAYLEDWIRREKIKEQKQKEAIEKEKQAVKMMADSIQNSAKMLTETGLSIWYDLETDKINDSLERQTEALDAWYTNQKDTLDNSRMSRRAYDRAIIELDKQKAAKEKEQKDKAEKAQKEAAKRNLAMQMILALANGAAASMQMWADSSISSVYERVGWQIAIAAETTAAVALLGSQMAQLKDGGIIGGNTPTGDKQVVRMNSGEMALNKSQQAELFAIANGKSGGSRVPQNIDMGDVIVQGNITDDQIDKIGAMKTQKTEELREMLEELNFRGSLRPIIQNSGAL